MELNCDNKRADDYFVFSGKITYIKGIHKLIKAFLRFSREFPTVDLVIIGTGDRLKRAQKIVSGSEIKNKIKIAKENGSITFKTIHKRKDGSAVLVQENLQYLKEKNKYKGIVREDYSLNKSSK